MVLNNQVLYKKAIPSMLKNKDIIAQAQSGTGKTAFTIGTLGQINIKNKSIQGIILSPTRELSKQIYDVLSNIGKMMSGLRLQLLVGGTSIEDDVNELKKYLILLLVVREESTIC